MDHPFIVEEYTAFESVCDQFRLEYEAEIPTEAQETIRERIASDPKFKRILFGKFDKLVAERVRISPNSPESLRKFSLWFRDNIKGIRRSLRYARAMRRYPEWKDHEYTEILFTFHKISTSHRYTLVAPDFIPCYNPGTLRESIRIIYRDLTEKAMEVTGLSVIEFNKALVKLNAYYDETYTDSTGKPCWASVDYWYEDEFYYDSLAEAASGVNPL